MSFSRFELCHLVFELCHLVFIVSFSVRIVSFSVRIVSFVSLCHLVFGSNCVI